MRAKFIISSIFICCLHRSLLFGHDQPVHFLITLNAATAALNNSPSYAAFMNAISQDVPYLGPNGATNSMAWGSWFEDNNEAPGDAGGRRSLNHFYDPLDIIYYKGLSDSPTDNRMVVGTNSFLWGSTSNCVGYNFPGVTWFDFGRNENTENIWSWPNARGYEWIGLTATNQFQRQTNLLYMFRALGQVVHLLQDCSQPQHVRNEQHLDQILGFNTTWRSPIEDYGNEYVDQLNYGDGSMLDWRGAGFTRLEDFWDRHLYAPGNGTVLNNAEASGGTQLGLAEWCNANFIGDRHQYAEYFHSGDIRHYPYPSLYTSTSYFDVKYNLTRAARMSFLRSGVQIKRIYLDKTGDGVRFSDHSVLTYFGVYFAGQALGIPSTTIRDPNVLANYHNEFIPKAVKYSAGLLDYYFRGTMNAQIVNVDSGAKQFTVSFLNTCSQDFSNGTFYIFQDDSGGDRTLIGQTNLTDLLPNGILSAASGVAATFAGLPGTNLIAVYQGTIGISNSAPLDPVDAGMAIAVAPLTPIIATANPLWTDSGFNVSSGADVDDYGNGNLGRWAGTDDRRWH